MTADARDARRYRARRQATYMALLRGLPAGHTTLRASIYASYDAESDAMAPDSLSAPTGHDERARVIEECKAVCVAQLVDSDEHGDPMGHEDIAYNEAISDCIAAIHALSASPPKDEEQR